MLTIKRISSDSFWHFIDYVGGYTFSVYLIHIYIWYIMLRLGVDGRSLLIRIIMPFLIMGMSMTIVWVVRKIPIVRRIVP